MTDLPEGDAGDGLQSRLTRAADVMISGLALLLLSPVLLLIGLAIRLDSRGPIIYRQVRIGLDRRQGRDGDEYEGRRTMDMGGRPFVIYKFRTMKMDAEQESGPVWASPEDDRVTRVGRFLRKYRLDELPQFWNVLVGDMSIVGPRPERPSMVHHLRQEIDAYQIRQRVRPGITGWAQIHRDADRTVDDVRTKLHYDLAYLNRRSLAFDLWIMMRTVPVMLERDSIADADADGRSDRKERDGTRTDLPSTART